MDLGKDPIVPTVFKSALPLLIAQVVNMMYNFVDRIYVGQIEEYGTQALAALGVCFPVTTIISSFSSLIAQGSVPYATMKLGEGKVEEANIIFNNAFVALLFLGIVAIILVETFAPELLLLFGCPNDSLEHGVTFLRYYSAGSIFILMTLGMNPFITAQGRAYISMCTVMIGAVLNIIFDTCLITVGKLGIKAAGISSLSAQFFSATFVLTFFMREESVFKFNVRYFRPRKTLFRTLLLGLGPFIMQLTESAIQIVYAIQLRAYSGDNSNYTASITILLSAIQLMTYPLNGFGQGSIPVASFNFGARQIDRVRKVIITGTLFAFCYTIIIYLVSMIYPSIYSLIFSASDAVDQLIRQYADYFFFGAIMFFAQIIHQSMFIAMGQAGMSIFLAIFRKIILLIPLCFVLPLWMGIEGIYISEGISDLVAGITTLTLFCIRIPRVLKRQETLGYDPI